MRRPLIVVALTLASCYTAPKVEQFDKARTYSAPYSEVWTATVDMVSSLGVSVEAIEKESGLITVNPGSAAGGYCKCPGGLLTVITAWRGKYNIFVKTATDSTTTVQINSFFEGFNEAMGLKQWTPCASSGKLEAELFALIGEKL